MFDIFTNYQRPTHLYSFEMTAGRTRKRPISKVFANRYNATNEMYHIMSKHNLKIQKMYDDNHDKTYICTTGEEFHINRI